MPRSGDAISPGESAPVATWYTSGWKRWKLRRSMSVMSTGRAAEPQHGLQAAEATADDDDAMAVHLVEGDVASAARAPAARTAAESVSMS